MSSKKIIREKILQTPLEQTEIETSSKYAMDGYSSNELQNATEAGFAGEER